MGRYAKVKGQKITEPTKDVRLCKCQKSFIAVGDKCGFCGYKMPKSIEKGS